MLRCSVSAPHRRVTPQPLHAMIAVDLIESDELTFLRELGLWMSLSSRGCNAQEVYSMAIITAGLAED